MRWQLLFSTFIACCLLFLCNARPLVELDRNQALIGYSESSKERIVLTTAYGEILIRTFHDKAPASAKLVTDLARRGGGSGLNFYRHEHAAEGWGQSGFWGPPYGLLQGSLGDIAEVPPFENGIDIEKGHCCFIPSTKEFFIATVQHPEWNRAHAVWGEVDDLTVVDKIPFEPSFQRNDTFITTWLNSSVPFNISLRT